MTLSSGSRLGPYEILAPIGAGGMGEVYRAKDPRLGRDVAIKILPAIFSSDGDRLKRFEQEARAAGVLNHPNITIVYDIGQQDGAPYVVQELLEGETLRAELTSGRLPARKAVEYAIEIARGLAAAHERGIVHRDLKPENLFVTREGRLKILDFGLAKLTQTEGAASATNLPTATEPGVVMGTLGYMSPEQIKARPADARSDIFALGAILYEMLSGNRAFRGDSAGETIAAILKEDPPELSLSNKNVSPGLDRILRHCLEKNPERRFQSASDLAFDLEALSGTSGSVAAGPDPAAVRRRLLWPGIALLALTAGLAAGVLWLRRASPTPATFTQLTFRRGKIGSARFGPDGESVIFSASWDGQPDRVYTLRPGSPEWSALDLPPLELLSVSRSGELAVWVPPVRSGPSPRDPTLARVPLAGGSPRDVLEDVDEADWAPDGNSLAVTHIVDGRAQLEYPIGTVLYRSSDRVEAPRVSPRGDRVAFVDHPLADETIGSVMVADRPGAARALSERWFDLQGVVWRPDGGEIWFSASRAGSRDSIWAVDLSGKLRLLAAAPGSMVIQDVSAAGKALVLSQSYRDSLSGILPGETRARDFSWLDFSHARDLSDDGTTILFQEWGEGGGSKGGVYLRRVSDPSPIRLGDGFGLSLSPDGRRVLARLYTDPPRLVLLPTGAGQPEEVPIEGLVVHTGAWFPDGKRLLILASKGTEWAFWILELPAGAVRKLAVTRNPTANRAMMRSLISPDGRLLARMDDDRRPSLLSLESGESRAALGFEPLESAIGWTSDGKFLFVIRRDRKNIVVTRVDPVSGKREKWHEVEVSADPVGLRPGGPVLISADGRTIFWSYQRYLDELYLVEGLK